MEKGSSLWLSCFFELEGETLYSVRWYRDFVEFYRFLPANAPTAAQIVSLRGAFVDVSPFPLSLRRSTLCLFPQSRVRQSRDAITDLMRGVSHEISSSRVSLSSHSWRPCVAISV